MRETVKKTKCIKFVTILMIILFKGKLFVIPLFKNHILFTIEKHEKKTFQYFNFIVFYK